MSSEKKNQPNMNSGKIAKRMKNFQKYEKRIA